MSSSPVDRWHELILTVEKIGGRSMAATEALLDNVLLPAARRSSPYGRIVVVSAYAGVTDQLLESKRGDGAGLHRLLATGSDWRPALGALETRLSSINRSLFRTPDATREAEAFLVERLTKLRCGLEDLEGLMRHASWQGTTLLQGAREWMAALGEAHSAFNTALLLRERGVAGRFVDLTGWDDEAAATLEERIARGLDTVDPGHELPILTGYAQCSEGLLQRHGRGYTEVTLAAVAERVAAREVVVHKEFPLCSADPAIVGIKQARKVARISYDLTGHLASLGMEALHPQAARRLRDAAIPLRIRSSFESKDPGTRVLPGTFEGEPAVQVIAGRAEVNVLELFDECMQDLIATDQQLLGALKSAGLPLLGKQANASTLTHLVGGTRAEIEAALQRAGMAEDGRLSLARAALVSVLGAGLGSVGAAPRACRALAEAGIEPSGLIFGGRGTDLQVLVREDDLEPAIRALHSALVERSPGSAANRAAA